MAVVSRVCTLYFIDSVSSTRTWVATAAVQDTVAGGSVVITITETSFGATSPAVATTETLNVYNDAGALIRAFTLTPGSASQTVTLFFTDTGATGGAARCGTLSIDLRVTNNGVGTSYDYETDGSPASPPTTFIVGQSDRGWVRATTTAVVAVSNVALGGAVPASWAYPDTIYQRTTLGVVGYVARALTSTVGAVLSAASPSSVGPVYDVTHAPGVDNRFTAGSAAYTATLAALPNSTLTGLPYTVLTITTASLTIDPRVTATPLFQVDDDVFGTPPTIKDVAHQRLTSQQGFLSARMTNARAEGVNGVTYSTTLTPDSPGTPVTATGIVSQTQGGQAGWSPTLTPWASQLPGGTWRKVVTVTAPANVTGVTYLVSAGSLTYTLLAVDSRVSALISLSPIAAIEDRHIQPGDQFKISISIFNRETRVRMLPDSAPTLAMFRYHRTAGWQFLAADTVTWTAWAGVPADSFALTAEADTLSFARSFSTSSGWTATDIVAVQITYFINSTQYGGYIQRELTGAANAHDGYAIDAVQLALSGSLGMR